MERGKKEKVLEPIVVGEPVGACNTWHALSTHVYEEEKHVITQKCN